MSTGRWTHKAHRPRPAPPRPAITSLSQPRPRPAPIRLGPAPFCASLLLCFCAVPNRAPRHTSPPPPTPRRPVQPRPWQRALSHGALLCTHSDIPSTSCHAIACYRRRACRWSARAAPLNSAPPRPAPRECSIGNNNIYATDRSGARRKIGPVQGRMYVNTQRACGAERSSMISAAGAARGGTGRERGAGGCSVCFRCFSHCCGEKERYFEKGL